MSEPTTATAMPQSGEPAPDFTLPDGEGNSVSLAALRGQTVVLYFYPKDDTPGCTAEACSFRDNYAAITQLDAEVLGISSDSQSSHKGFAEKYHLPFPLLSDAGGAVRKAYKVPATLGLLPGRVTYVIDRHGVIRRIFTSQLNIERHIAEALDGLQAISGEE